ncbi:Armadillo-type fold [Senna tora]|uniref:Armadillo-type fold n=1 Tax=Senna tora TaxID=362788 RepID=A0A834TJW0_9FABA|nr:Armadillo-type fold [Senna tora]
MSSAFSPCRSPGSSRIQLIGVGGVSRLRSSSHKRIPEPLRRAVADCLSSSSLASSHHGGPFSTVVNEASRTLRDYLAAPPTIDLAYNVILEHTIAERERSPAVVTRCVALLKRYLLRYKPSEETLLQIDRFCSSIISECDLNLYRPWSRTLNQQSSASTTSTNVSPLPVSSFASEALVKSLSYVRSLVAQHIPKRYFQPAAFAGAPSASGKSLPSLSSLLSKSFKTQLSPVTAPETLEKDSVSTSVSKFSKIEKVDEKDELEFIAHDVLKWRWLEEHPSSSILDRAVNSQDMRAYNFLEVGAAALLVGNVEAKMKGQPWKFFGTDDMPYLDQLLQSSPVTTISNSVSSRPHLRAITASKRKKPDPRQFWEDCPMSTFRPRARPLFQYRHYSEQQPLRLNPAEVREVIAAVCSETSLPNNNVTTVTTRLSNNSGNPSMDVAVSVLIKLVIDMYVLDSRTAAPLTLSMLEEMLSSSKTACRVRAFDLILNLGVHAHLLEPMIADDASTIEEDYSQESYFDSDSQLMTQGSRKGNSLKLDISSAIGNFESWILNILYEILLLLVQTEEEEESVWASGLSCLLYFVCDRGRIWRNRLQGLDIRVIKALIETSWKNSWAELVHCKLVSLLTNMFYQVPDEATDAVPSTPKFLVDQLDLIGGVQFILLEYSLAKSSEERRNLYSVLFDYVLHQINETCIATGVNEYSDDEIQPLAALLAQTNAPEAFYISVKLGVEGIGEILRRSIASALSRYPNSERLNTLLEIVAEKFDAIISSFTHLDKEFSHMIQITKSHKFLENMEGVALRNGVGLKAKLSWATLHSLLHSERKAYRQNGYIWLGDLLIAEISGERDGSIWSNIKHFQQKIAHAGFQDSSDTSSVPLPISLMCGLLKSKHNIIRWGFLFVLERLLMRCKFLLDEHEMQHVSGTDVGPGQKDWHLEKANAVIDIMSSALWLVFQINETDRINILKMCDILFSQLCLRVPLATALPFGDDMQREYNLKSPSLNKKSDGDNRILKQDSFRWDEHNKEEADRRSSYSNNYHLDHETASMAALLLQGRAIVPMQLIARVPAALLYWPLIQLAGAATDNIALGVAVGSKGRGNLPGATSDIRATLLLLLIGKCTADPVAFQEVGLEQFSPNFASCRELLDDTDSRVAYYSSAFLLKRMMTEKPEKYQHMLQNLVVRAQQSNNEKLLENPYLQMRGILQLANDLGTDL